MDKTTTITIESTIDSPVDAVWDLWTGPEHIVRWNNASDDWHTTFAENDLRIGGKFLSRMEAKDGSFGFDFTGTYTELEPNKLIAYTMDDERRVRITFESNGAGVTRIETAFEPETENSIEMQRGGWQAILDNFKKYAEANKSLAASE